MTEIVKTQILDFINDKNKHEISIKGKYLLIKHLYKDNVFLYLKDIYSDAITTIHAKYEYQGHNFTFKTDTQEFFKLDNRYSRYYMKAKDRHKYEELFKYQDYLFEEITSITYGKQTIYCKQQIKKEG